MSRPHPAIVWAVFLLGTIGLFGTLAVATYEISGGNAVCYDPRQDSAFGDAHVSWVPPGARCSYRSTEPPGEIAVPVPQGRTILILLGASSIALTWPLFEGWQRRIARSFLVGVTALFVVGVVGTVGLG